MFEKLFCPYCGLPLSEGCECAVAVAEYEAELMEDLDVRQLANAWQQDVIDMYRRER